MDKYTTSLLHCNGANASTFLRDEVAGRYWSPQSTARLETAQHKFGVASLYPNGGYYTNVLDLGAFSFGSGDFTVEGWAYPTSLGAGTFVFTLHFGATYHPLYIVRTATKWRLFMASNGSASWDIANDLEIGTALLNTWQHVAVNRIGTDINAYVNGVLVDVATTAAALPAPTHVDIGGYTGGQHWVGYLDEIRVSKGIGRYPAAFTPLAGPFTDRGHVLRPGRRDRWLGW